MPRFRNIALALGAVLIAVGFIVGLRQLFTQKFETGDIYPDYSTLNTTPKGTKAYYESLERFGSPSVSRNFLPLLQFKNSAGTTLVFTGAARAFFGEDTEKNFEFFEGLMKKGLHVIASMHPHSMVSFSYQSDSTKNPWSFTSSRSRKSLSDPESDDEMLAHILAAERWGFAFRAVETQENMPRQGYTVTLDEKSAALRALPRWYSPWRWTDLTDEWKVLASAGGDPVIIRRSFDRGSLTLLSDSSFLSNEGLARAPQPEFLLWILGGQPHVVFDETLHGTSSTPGIMYLARQYHLLGFFIAATILLGLFFWRSSTSLVPPHDSIASLQTGVIQGAEGSTGFTNLLRQSIPRQTVLRTCFQEWAKSPFIRRRYSDEAVAAVRDIVHTAEADKKSDPATVFQTIRHTLATLRKS